MTYSHIAWASMELALQNVYCAFVELWQVSDAV